MTVKLTESSVMRTRTNPTNTKPEIVPKGQKSMKDNNPCNYRSPYTPKIQYYDDQTVIINGKAYTRNQPTPVVIREDENIIIVGGVKYEKVDDTRPATIYDYLVECESTWEASPHAFDKKAKIFFQADRFLNYLYERCKVIQEDDNQLVVSISKEQMVLSNDFRY